MNCLNKPLDFIRNHQPDFSMALFVAAAVIGVCSEALLPVMPGAEMWTLAKNLAATGTFANPFVIHATGLTANNPPLYPFLLAVLIKLLRRPILVYGASVLGSIFANALTAVLLPRISRLLFDDAVPGFFASVLWLGAMQLIPGWDTNWTLAGLLFFCIFTISNFGAERNAARCTLLGGAIAGFLWLANPASMLISLPWAVFLCWRQKITWRRSFRLGAMFLAVFCVFVFFWCGRNYFQLGGFVSRTNLGIALYASNNDCAQSTLTQNLLTGCQPANHPSGSLREAVLLEKIGELPYDQMRTADAKAWMRAHPQRFLELTTARVLEFWFPAWIVIPPDVEFANKFDSPNYTQHWVGQQNRIACAFWAITALSLPGIFFMARRREPVLLFVLVVMGIYPLMYYLIVSDVRYRYPMLWISLLPAGYFLRELMEWGLRKDLRH